MERKSSKKGFGKRQKETETSQAKVPLFKKWNDKRKRERKRIKERGKRKFLFVPRKILRNCIKPHSHPNGFYWGPQCSWTITSANSMQEHLEMLNRYLPVDNSLIWNYYMLVVSLRSSFVGRRRCVLLFEYGSVQMPFANYNYIH